MANSLWTDELSSPARPATTGRHRGQHPDDARLFSRVSVAGLAIAAEELAWLLGRGYAPGSALDIVSHHHQLELRQRRALARAACSDRVRDERHARLVPLRALAGQAVCVDGLNVVVTLEVALSGGVVLRCRDDTLRDLAGPRRNYHPVTETERAITLLADMLRHAGARSARVVLDARVSNSGRLRERFEKHARRFGCGVTIDLVPDASRALAGLPLVASSEPFVIDRAKSWINLARAAVAQSVHDAWVVNLG